MKAHEYNSEEYEDLYNEHYYTGEFWDAPAGCLDIAEDLGPEERPTPHERTAEAFGRTFTCAAPGCQMTVTGIYCDAHRQELQSARRLAREARSESMKQRWEKDREGMIAAIRSSRAPATEEKAK